jgi:hypothetical protein
VINVFPDDSQKPAKVAIYRCTVESIAHGPIPVSQIELSFLHFPNCRNMAVGERYVCAIRNTIGNDYELVRSDMLGGAARENIYNCFWVAESEQAKLVLAGVSQDE